MRVILTLSWGSCRVMGYIKAMLGLYWLYYGSIGVMLGLGYAGDTLGLY